MSAYFDYVRYLVLDTQKPANIYTLEIYPLYSILTTLRTWLWIQIVGY